MTQAVLCPQCGKKFGLPAQPPAQFTCTQCGTLMDLSAFGGADKPAPPAPRGPAAPAVPRGGGRRPRGAARESRAAGRAPAGPPRRSSSNGTQVVLAIVGVLVLVVVLIVATKGEDVPDAPREHDTSASILRDPPSYDSPTPSERTTERDVPVRPRTRPTLRRNRDGSLRLSGIVLQDHAWPEEVDRATRTKVEEALRAMYIGGRDGVEARAWLVQQGRPICGRLINEFKALAATPGFEDREGTSMAGVVDGTLRSIDGVLERTLGERERIRAWGVFAGPKFVTKIAKCWTWWWTTGEWRDNPQKPWDPHDDESDDAADGIKRTDPAAKKKGSGYQKRAGSD